MRTKDFLVAATVLAAAACGPFHLGNREHATIIFSNETTDQADVYAFISTTQTIRIGTVFGLRTDTLSVPTSVTDQGGTTNIVARLLARSYRPSTGTITLRAPDVIKVRLTSDGRNLFVTPP